MLDALLDDDGNAYRCELPAPVAHRKHKDRDMEWAELNGQAALELVPLPKPDALVPAGDAVAPVVKVGDGDPVPVTSMTVELAAAGDAPEVAGDLLGYNVATNLHAAPRCLGWLATADVMSREQAEHVLSLTPHGVLVEVRRVSA